MIDYATGSGLICFSRSPSGEEENRLYELLDEAGFLEPWFLEGDRLSTYVYAEAYHFGDEDHMDALNRIALEFHVTFGNIEYRESGGDGDLWRHVFIPDALGGKWEEQIGKIVYFDGKEWV